MPSESEVDPGKETTESTDFIHNPDKELNTYSRVSFKALKHESEHEWNNLPDSVIGTLIYFLLVEHDSENFHVCETIWILLLVGFPVYLTYSIQCVILYQLFLSLPQLNDPVNSGFCTNDYQLNLVALAFFFVQVMPIFTDVVSESYIVLRCERLARYHSELDNEITVETLHAPMSKRAFIWMCVNLVEMCILCFLCVVGPQLILTSPNASGVVLNCVSILFVMDIDNFAREVFQVESISEHVDAIHFDTKLKTFPTFKSQGLDSTISPDKLLTFWSIEKPIFVMGMTIAIMYVLEKQNCS